VKKIGYFNDKKPNLQTKKLATPLSKVHKHTKKSNEFDFVIGGNMNEENIKMAKRSYGQAMQFYQNASFTRDSLKIEHRASGKLVLAFRKTGNRSLDIAKTQTRRQFNLPLRESMMRGHSLS